MSIVSMHCRDSPEESKDDEPSPVLMLRNLKEEVRKEDVSGETPVPSIICKCSHRCLNLPLSCRYLELLVWICPL